MITKFSGITKFYKYFLNYKLMTTITTSIGTTFIVKKSIDDINQTIKNKAICIFTLTNGETIAISSKHIAHLK